MKMTIFEEFDRIFEKMFSESPLVTNPVWYGCRVTSGPNGPPEIQEFGNRQNSNDNTIEVDVIPNVEKKQVKLVAEIPGVEKNDIHIVVEGNDVVIDATRGEKKYHARVPLRHQVVQNNVKASYRNGILEIVFGTENRPKGRRVRVN